MQAGTARSAEPTPALIFETLNAHQRSAALRAAIELNLFGAIGQGPADAATLGARCSASERGVRILCDYLTTLGFLEKQGRTYRHSPTSALFLDPKSPACLASMTGFLSRPEITEPYARLAEMVRSGRTVLPGLGTVEPENPLWVEFARSMAPMMAQIAGPLADLVLRGRKDPMLVLDIAAGHGLFGIEIAKRNPAARIMALDWAPVLEVACDNALQAGVAARYCVLAGSAFEVDFDGPYDAVLLTNFLHHFDQPACVGLLKKVRAALKPGGLAATLEFVPNEDRISPPMAAQFSLIMLASTAAGDAYTFNEYDSMHRAAGFVGVESHPLPASPHTVVLARVP